MAFLLVLLFFTASSEATEESRKPISSSEVLKEIESNQSVEYNHVIIIGDLSLISKIVSSTIAIRDSIIEGNVDMSGSRFNESVYFQNTEFRGNVDFSYCDFNNYVDFQKSKFLKQTSLSNSIFHSGAQFSECWFNGELDFINSKMNWMTIFYEAKFNNNAYFTGTEFKGDTNFDSAQFTGDAIFRNSNFLCSLYFSYVRFNYIEIQWNNIYNFICKDDLTYLGLIKNFRDRGQFEDSNSCYYNYRMWILNKESWGASKILDLIIWSSCGYGVRPSHTLAMSLIMIFIFAALYWLFNGFYISSMPNASTSRTAIWSFSLGFISFKNILKGEKINNLFKMIKEWAGYYKSNWRLQVSKIGKQLEVFWRKEFIPKQSFNEAIYFSTMVFISRPPQHWLPREKWRYAVMIEGILGWLLLALFIATLTKIAIR